MSAPPTPQHDAFYRAPAGWRATRPGTILRHRPVALAAFGTLPQQIQSWQLMFRSTGTTGEPIVAVTTVLIPAAARPKALLSYQIAEDASAPQCAPSYTLRLDGTRTEAVNQAELLLIDASVGEGFAVSVPDYEGVEGDFGVAKQPGYIVLDGVRAAERFAPLKLSGTKTAAGLWGYSGGSLASGWAAQVQHRYAPHLHIRGVAVGGFVTDVPGALLKINAGPASGLIASALPGIIRGDAAIAKLLRPELTAAGKQMIAHAGSQCEIANVTQYPFENFSRYVKHSIPALLARPAFRKQIDRLNLGGSAPAAPMFVYHAVNDELIPVAGPDAMVKSYCARGSSVDYTRDELSEHGSLAFVGAAAALDWLSAHTIGNVTQHGCTTMTVPTMAVSPATLSTLPAVVQSILLALAGLPVGGAT
ncbi:MAG TPA: lipase family protein [Mycobacteriales bacterium]|nr:lipase family protein [Mycobacteriales bacterium]